MARRRFFVDEVHHGRAVIAGDEAKHLRQVLRAEVGQRYELSDGNRVFLGEVESFRKGEITFAVMEELPQPPVLLEVTLFAALIKFDRFELLVEKATELGVQRIVPVVAARSEKGLEKAAPKRLERWRRISLEAAKQSHRVQPAAFKEPVTLEEALAEGEGLRLILDEDETKPLVAMLPAVGDRAPGDRVSLLVGAEGGWTDHERTAAKEAGFVSASLGTLVLRAETAAIAALSVLQAEWYAAALQSDTGATPRLSF